jgi:uncharacterized protein YndB with AHSA1/START domain
MPAYLLIGLGVIVAVFFVIVASRPSEFCVTRKAVMVAPVAMVFEQVNDLRKWRAWSPWAKMDPAAKNSFEGPEAGAGAVMRWAGSHKVGAGSMTITESRPGELVQLRLEFLKPFKATNAAEFTFKAEGNRTLVTWSMLGKSNFMSKVFGVFVDCDKMIGGQFENGLAAMKLIVEYAPKGWGGGGNPARVC